MKSRIKRWGSVGMIHIPMSILEQANLKISSPINLEVSDGRIIITGLENSPGRLKLPFTEEDLLKGLGAYSAHADELINYSLTSEWET